MLPRWQSVAETNPIAISALGLPPDRIAWRKSSWWAVVASRRESREGAGLFLVEHLEDAPVAQQHPASVP